MVNGGSASHAGAGSRRVLAADDGVVIGEIGPVCVVIWRKTVTQARVDMVGASLAQVVKHNAPGTGFLAIVEASSGPPDERLRRQLVALVAQHADSVKCIATVIEATGFTGAMIRGVIAGMHLLDRGTIMPRAPFRDVTSAARWMRAHVPLNDGFANSVEELRLRFAG